jgi:ABC-2 type transport system ATP-binding protein
VEEIERILTDIIFINDGHIVLDESMESLGERYMEVAVVPDRADEARALKPIFEHGVLGRRVFLFEGQNRDRLESLGESRVPGSADIFVAKIKGATA